MSKYKKTATSSIESKVMEQIESGRVKMRPHYYYSLVTVLSVFMVAVLAIALSYLLSLTSLWLRIQTASGRAYGARQNLTSLVNNFPWWAVILALVAIAGLIILVKKIGPLYRIRLVHLIPAIIIVAAIIGYSLSYTQLPNVFKKQHNQAMCSGSNSNCTTQVKGYRFGQ
jgi:hypothetical protein